MPASAGMTILFHPLFFEKNTYTPLQAEGFKLNLLPFR